MKFDSRKNYLKIFDQDTVSVAKPDTADGTAYGGFYSTTTIQHDLGYRPIVRAWFSPDSNDTWYPMYGARGYAPGGNTLDADFECFISDITTASVTFRTWRATATSGSFSLHYKIYQDPAS